MPSIFHPKIIGIPSLKSTLLRILQEIKDKSCQGASAQVSLLEREVALFKEEFIKNGDEEAANSAYLFSCFLFYLESFSKFVSALLDKQWETAWSFLQDSLDPIKAICRFVSEDELKYIKIIKNQLNQIEKLFPYKIFVSSEFLIKRKTCSICKNNVLSPECLHIQGNLYWGQMACYICEELSLIAVAMVKNPVDKRCIAKLMDSKAPDHEHYKPLILYSNKLKDPLTEVEIIESEKLFKNDLYFELGRNDICSCGSKKKVKKCCGKEEYVLGGHVHIEFLNSSIFDLCSAMFELR